MATTVFPPRSRAAAPQSHGAGTLYLLTVTLTLTTAALAFRLDLHRSYYLTDVLLLYTLVVFIAAGVLSLMATRRS